ncbi:unnamed protein product, partial [Bubo scandiacus]
EDAYVPVVKSDFDGFEQSPHSSPTCFAGPSKSRTPDVSTRVHLPCPSHPRSSPRQFFQGQFIFRYVKDQQGHHVRRAVLSSVALTLLCSS